MSKTDSLLPIQVHAVLAVSDEQTTKNIQENLHIIPTWFDRLFYPNGFEAIIISAGPSMEKYVEALNLKERMDDPDRSFVVFCVKHALPRLLAMGVEPDFCVILDGRPLEEKSTHGHYRKDLFKVVPKKTIFLVASMASSDYAKYLIAHGARVMGWHTDVNALKEFLPSIKEPVLGGGTSSGGRSVSLAHALGIRDITLVGFDSCIHSLTEEEKQTEKDFKGRSKYIEVDLLTKEVPSEFIETLGSTTKEVLSSHNLSDIVIKTQAFKRYTTTGELLAQAQDFEKLFTNKMFDIHFRVYDDGLVSHIFRNCDPIQRDFSFIQFFKKAVPKQDFNVVDEKKDNSV